jgi:hypothetical protein
MNHRWVGVTAALTFVCSTTMASQSAGVQRSAREQTSTNKGITVVGCLQRVDTASESAKRANANGGGAAPSSAGTGGTSAAVAPLWILASATISSGTGAATTSGERDSTAAKTGSTRSGATYVLEGRLDALPAHVGHRVEVKGTLSGTPSSGGVSDAPGSASDTPGSTASAGSGSRTVVASAGHMQVTSVRTISQSCTSE